MEATFGDQGGSIVDFVGSTGTEARRYGGGPDGQP
jgi:hypothetical protein